MDCCLPSVHGILQARILECGEKKKKNAGVGSYSLLQGNLPHPGIEPESLTLQVDSLPSEPPGKSLLLFLYLQYLYKAVIIS